MQYVLILADITDFAPDGPLEGLSNSNGVLYVLQNGTYYIYAQAFFEPHPGTHRLQLVVNGQAVSLLQNSAGTDSKYGNRFTGAIKKLNAGDYICLRAAYESKLWMGKAHTFYGAMSIDIQSCCER